MPPGGSIQWHVHHFSKPLLAEPSLLTSRLHCQPPFVCHLRLAPILSFFPRSRDAVSISPLLWRRFEGNKLQIREMNKKFSNPGRLLACTTSEYFSIPGAPKHSKRPGCTWVSASNERADSVYIRGGVWRGEKLRKKMFVSTGYVRRYPHKKPSSGSLIRCFQVAVPHDEENIWLRERGDTAGLPCVIFSTHDDHS